MFKVSIHARRRVWPAAVSLLALMCASPVFAQDAGDQDGSAKKQDKKPTLSQTKPVSANATVNLLNLMVKRKLLTQDEADGLISQAESESYVSRQAAKDATQKADEAAKAATAATAAANPPGTRHVSYVPEVVKRQLREEIKQEVMAKAEKENWASPGMYPEWAQRIHFYGDFRGRYQGDFFQKGNDQLDAINFNAINTGSPYDITNTNPYNFPTYNATQDRNQVRLRARLGMDADLTNNFSAGLRIATGQDNSPVSTNQTLGANGGNFSKYQLWLDRGYLKWDTRDLTVSVGRFDNPFFAATDLAWYSELGFDGVAVQAKHEISEGITPFVVGGVFPLFNTDFNLGTNALTAGDVKFASHDKWLFGGQIGTNVKLDEQHSFTLGVAFYDFDNVQGQISSPCFVTSSTDVCDTDQTRPSFAQKGNSYMPLRSILITDPTAPPPALEYFGLVGQYRPLVASGRFDFGEFHPYHIVLDGEYIVNTAFDRGLMNLSAMNNRGPSPDGGNTPGTFNGGNQGWMGRVTIGNKEIKHFGDWNVHAGYKYLESDATLDAFVDPDFGLGGTNLKGYILGANYGLSDNVWLTARWMSATNIGGIPYAVDVLQVDVNAKF